ncbi:MAG: hypothetical protein NUV60_01775 [Patescibacteria group bacterium]|nr:hypothetical protein [Patescibacteria group bacterium]
MKKRLFVLLITAGIILSGCVVVPTGPRPTIVRPAYTVIVEDGGAPPAKYIVEGERPIFYNIEPGIAFYPVFFGFPGSCFCYMPVRYVGGI